MDDHATFLNSRLHGGIWHVTRPDRFISIMAGAGLIPEPDLPNAERWKTAGGPDYYPFVRKIGGVSLFDFRNFDADAYDQSHKMSSWRTFVPCPERWEGAVWVRINLNAIIDRYLSTDEIVRRWDEGGHHRHTIMPRIEAACIGGVPVAAFSRAFLTSSRGQQVREIELSNFDRVCLDVGSLS